MNPKKIGAFLKRLRNEKGITQEQLAEMIGVKPAHISNIESGKKPFSFNVFVRLYTALKVNPDSLLLRYGELRDARTEERHGSEEMTAMPGCEALREAVDAAIMQWWEEHMDV